MSEGLGSASLLENARFNATVVVPNAIQGIFRRRRQAVRAATAANVDGHAVGLLEGFNRSYEGGPVWVKIARDDAILLLDPADIARILGESPDPFASDPEGKRKGMVHFQPEALTISRGEDWASRRRFAETILGEASRDRVEAVAREEAEEALAEADGELTYEPWDRALARTARRVVLGDAAAGDWALTDTLNRMMSSANGMPGKPADEVPVFERRIAAYIERAEEGSLAALVPSAPKDERVRPETQLTHWLFAMSGTIAANTMRALAVLASHAEQRERALGDVAHLDACLHETMRLWPTTNMLARVSTKATEWDSDEIPADTQFLIVNHYSHRDRDRIPYADRFAPEEWTDGDASAYPGFNHFSRGPQGCPGTALALLAGRTVVREALERGVEAVNPELDPSKPLPHMIDFFGIRVRTGTAAS